MYIDVDILPQNPKTPKPHLKKRYSRKIQINQSVIKKYKLIFSLSIIFDWSRRLWVCSNEVYKGIRIIVGIPIGRAINDRVYWSHSRAGRTNIITGIVGSGCRYFTHRFTLGRQVSNLLFKLFLSDQHSRDHLLILFLTL